jgi:Ca2+-binding RTX toxin-like protein
MLIFKKYFKGLLPMANAATSTELRTLIQNANILDPIINLTALTPNVYSVTTLAKTPSNISQPAVPFSGYTIQSSVALSPPAQGASIAAALTREFSNTRIYQQNIDGPYSPGLIKDVELIYSTGNDALLSATTGNFALSNVRFTGNHSGWAGNGNKYISLTSFNAATPLNVPLSLTNVSVTISGQNGFDGTNGGSAFLHSWNNSGAVSITNSSFDESGFASTINLLGTGALPSGNYTITNNSFNRTTNALNRTVRPSGNRLQNVNATLSNNIFTQGSYLDLYGNISGITIGAAATMNTFNTITDPNTSVPGYGIRITAPNTPASSKTLLGSNAFTGPGLPLKYVNAAANTSYTLTGGTITVNGTTFTNLIAGGQGADTISGTTNADWINGDDGADSISGLAGNDSILGGEGNDTIEGGVGNDTLNGGNGIDTLSYAGSAAGVTVNLATNSASGGDASTDVISLFENLIGSASADTLTGDTSANSIDGGAGNDTIDGGAGNDTIVGGTGNDSMTGGLGLDVFVTGQAGDSTAATSQAGGGMVGQPNMGNAWALTFGNGVDVITGFETTDTIDVATAATAPTNLNNQNNNFNLVANVTYVMYGSWTSNTFTQANNWSITNNDALVVVGDAGNLNPVNTTGYVLLENLGAALAATNFV